MKKYLITTILFFGTFLAFTSSVNAWFGAGQTPGWPVTSTGLKGEIQLPVYKFAPDFYNIGDSVNLTVKGTNTTSSSVDSHYFLVIHKVKESPTGTDISDGTPTTPGVNENDLYTNYKSGNDVETSVTSIDLGNQTFPSNGDHSFSGSYTTTEVGYFKFDFVDSDSSEYSLGNILASGFIRVLNKNKPTPTASPMPTTTPCDSEVCPTPTASPTVTSTPATTTSNGGSGVSDGLGCANHDCSSHPSTPNQILGASTTNGQVLGTSTMAGTGSFDETFYQAIMSLGAVLSAFGIKGLKKSKKVSKK